MLVRKSGPTARRVLGRQTRVWILCSLATAGVIVAALLVGVSRGSSYQPVAYGRGGSAIAGGTVLVRIATNGSLSGQQYIPPQRSATGNLIVSLMNTGAYAVTIESVGLPSQPSPTLLGYNGPATYVPLTGNNPTVTGSSPRIAGIVLRPGEDVLVRIPFRTPGCWRPGRIVLATFMVTTRYLLWTHRFAVSFVDFPAQSDGKIFAQVPC